MKLILLGALFLTNPVFAAETLIIGDSHVVGSFGEHLHKLMLQETKADVRTVGLAGATATSFTSTNAKQRTLSYGYADRKNQQEVLKKSGHAATAPELSVLLKESRPSRVIVELGDNFAHYQGATKASDAMVEKQVQSILTTLHREAPSAQCIWVTPTWTDKSGKNTYAKSNERLKQVIHLIKKTAEPKCQVIDSTQDLGLTPDNLKTVNDGLHFDGANGKKWATAVAAQIMKLEKKSSQSAQPAVAAPEKSSRGTR